MADRIRLKGLFAGLAAKKLELEVTPELLDKMGTCLVGIFAQEAKKDFAKRGWSGMAHDGSEPIWDSFDYRLRGEKTIEVTSTFPDIDKLTNRSLPPFKMKWLTQEQRNLHPSRYNGGSPLVVPMKDNHGKVVYRTAPLTTHDAWIHPGIARFTFIERAVRKGRQRCLEIVAEEMGRVVAEAIGKR